MMCRWVLLLQDDGVHAGRQVHLLPSGPQVLHRNTQRLGRHVQQVSHAW